MTAVEKIDTELRKLGYSPKSLVRNYRFSDILVEDAPVREVALAAFTDTPFSYRNAAFGVIQSGGEPISEILTHRALGAPVWLCIVGDVVEVWNTEDSRAPRRVSERAISELPALFQENCDLWYPDRLHTAKMAGLWDGPVQLSLIDFGLLRSIERGVQKHLDRVIRDTLRTLLPSENSRSIDYQNAYRTCFYLLAAKILQDRQHPVSNSWNTFDAQNVLETIQSYYGLAYIAQRGRALPQKQIAEAWVGLRGEVSFANISADDLAFVYENTLVAPETRKQLGTHSTPRAVAEFLVSRLQLGKAGTETPIIYEPFCGSGVLLVAALSAIKSSLPREWTDAMRHDFLIKRLRGSDIDPFACEVASLSLVLADYPSANGWDICQTDLFSPDALVDQLEAGMIVLCNPPFETFTQRERQRYPEISELSLHKPVAVIKKILESKPEAIGFVMPHAIIGGDQYGELRKELENYFDTIELVALPDRIFVESAVESALLVAKNPRPQEEVSATSLHSGTVRDSERNAFLDGAYHPQYRHKTKIFFDREDIGKLWVSEFSELWEYLDAYPRLGSLVELHRGIEWQPGYQALAVSGDEKSGYRPGLHSSKELRQFLPPHPVYLDCREQNLRGGAIKHRWDEPKLVLNAARKSRGPWRLAACVDHAGWVLSQQLVGCWCLDGRKESLGYIEALLNSPVASAFVSEFSSRQRFNLTALEEIPIPRRANKELILTLVEEIHSLSKTVILEDPYKNEKMENALLALDAELLEGYQLPARLERKLLLHFEGGKRPIYGDFNGYPVSRAGMAVSLKECLEGRFEHNRGDWVREVFQPLPKSERNALANFI